MATSAEATPVSFDTTAARRTWRWAAILLQAETLGALLLACVHLLTHNTAAGVNPMFALFAFLAATVLLPFSKAIQRGDHGAGLVLAVLWSLRALQILLAPMATILKQAPLLVLEGVVFGRALVAMSKAGVIELNETARERMRRLVRTYAPIAFALAMITYVPLRYARELAFNGPELAASIHTILAIVLLVFGALLAFVHRAFAQDVDAEDSWTSQVRGLFVYMPRPTWPVWAWADFTIGIVTMGCAALVLTWFAGITDRPSGHVSAALLIPLAALFYFPLGIAWLGIGIAEIKRKPWAKTARLIAAIPLLLMLMLFMPMVPGLIVLLLQSLAP